MGSISSHSGRSSKYVRPGRYGGPFLVLDDLAARRALRAIRRLEGKELPRGAITLCPHERGVFALPSPPCKHVGCLQPYCERVKPSEAKQQPRQPWEVAA